MSTFHEALEKLEALIAARQVKPVRQRRERRVVLQLKSPLRARKAGRPVARRQRETTSIPLEAP
ncbi:MAG: hypothetical protein Q8N23_14035 [Archangium sp.]|nr:hypothetical protein [Archangium sp.]MDP3153793.1 hypothetical protein [Archangium sp.]MDP3569374.1 hypothetical protein [Archangium sp.]